MLHSRSARRFCRAAGRLAAPAVLLASLSTAAAQAPLYLVDEATTVRGITFRYEGDEVFPEKTLKTQIALTEPTFFDRIKRALPLLEPTPRPFNPVELQKDVVRLRLYFRKNGFLYPDIDYATSELDTTSNAINIIYTIDPGPPLILQDVNFVGPDSNYAYFHFDETRRPGWEKQREAITVRAGDRYTEFDRLRIQDMAITWMKNAGYAFANASSEVDIDSVANTADLRFRIDPGPVARYDSILVEGNRSVEDNVILRELPFKPGQVFSQKKLTAAQRELFSLSLFRVALTSVPEQPRDSTVNVLLRVRESQLRYVTAQTGYARDIGVRAEGEWTHRNFFGAARTFTASSVLQSGLLAVPGGQSLPERLVRGAVSVRQPYIFSRRLSGTVSPFVQLQRDPQLFAASSTGGAASGKSGAFNTREMGVNSALLFELYPFRTVTLQHTFSRALQFTPPDPDAERLRDVYNRSVLSAGATLGKVGDFLNPDRGYLVRPGVETGGFILGSDIAYTKGTLEGSLYQPLMGRFTFATRLSLGRLQPTGKSKRALDEGDTPRGRLFENRFDPIMFYVGGANDVRGWGSRMIGPKIPQRIVTKGPGGAERTSYVYEAVGGRSKAVLNLELRMPFPGLGPAWSTAAFLDGGMVAQELPTIGDFRWGSGGGIRYKTIVGYIRLDLAYKLRYDPTDLQDAQAVYEYRNGLSDEEPASLGRRRFALHLSIGQAF